MQTTPRLSGVPLRMATRSALMLGLLLLAAPQGSALPFENKLNVKGFSVSGDLLGVGTYSASASRDEVEACFHFYETGPGLNADITDGAVLLYVPVPSSEGGRLGLLGQELPNRLPLGPYEIGDKQYGWGTQEAGVASNGCPEP